MKRKDRQLQLPLSFDDNNKGDNHKSAKKTPTETYKEGECHCTCAGCDMGYHCHKKERGCGM